jgi:hypothetical protein
MPAIPVTRPADHYTLRGIAGLIKATQFAPAPFDPQGRWRRVYERHTLTGGPTGLSGTLTIDRAPTPGVPGLIDLSVALNKFIAGAVSCEMEMRLTARNDRLATPVQWSLRFVPGQHRPFDGGRSDDSRQWGALTEGRLTFKSNAGPERNWPVDGPCALDWGLFEAVGRLPRAPGADHLFTLIDTFDSVKSGHVLRYRHAVTVPVGPADAPTRLHGVERLGPGILPWIYWLDDFGRPLFVVSGIQAFILQSEQEPVA